jgi:glycosyltransferase involved in cell wall biosynthesis
MTSIDEGLGTAALDAVHAGCAMVVSDVGGLPEIVTNDQTGLLVPPRDPAAIAAAITRLATAPELRAGFARAAQDKIRREFSVDAMVEGNIHVYESLVPR